MADSEVNEKFKVVKISINQFINYFDKKPKLHDYIISVINDYAYSVNIAIFEAYALANLWTILQLHNKKSVSFGQDFFQHCLIRVTRLDSKNVKTSKTPKTQNNDGLDEAFTLYSKQRPTDFHVSYRDNIPFVLTTLARQMHVAANNHIFLNFYNRFRKFIAHKYPTEDANKITQAIYKKQEEFNNKENNPIITEYRNKLSNIPPSIKNLTAVMNIYNEILSYTSEKLGGYEKQKKKKKYKVRKNKRTGKPRKYKKKEKKTEAGQPDKKQKKQKKLPRIKLFSLLPMKGSFTPSYIPFPKSAISNLIGEFSTYGLFECLGIKDKKDLKEKYKDSTEDENLVNTEAYKINKKLFNVEKLETKKYKFHHFMTNGKTVSVYLGLDKKTRKRTTGKKKTEEEKKEKKSKKKSSQPLQLENKILIGLDPGIKYMYTTAELTTKEFDPNEKLKISHYSGKEYYHNSWSNEFNKKESNLRKNNSEIDNFMKNIPTNKTNEVNKMCKYLQYVLPKIHEVLDFYMLSKYRSWKFTKYQKTQSEMMRICKNLSKKNDPKDPEKVIIGFGDWSIKNSPIKGHRRGPVKKLQEELRKWTTVIEIDEYCTSKLWAGLSAGRPPMRYRNDQCDEPKA